jgi:hypothetical protein
MASRKAAEKYALDCAAKRGSRLIARPAAAKRYSERIVI